MAVIDNYFSTFRINFDRIDRMKVDSDFDRRYEWSQDSQNIITYIGKAELLFQKSLLTVIFYAACIYYSFICSYFSAHNLEWFSVA